MTLTLCRLLWLTSVTGWALWLPVVAWQRAVGL